MAAQNGVRIGTHTFSLSEAKRIHQALKSVPIRGYQQNPGMADGPGPVHAPLLANFEDRSAAALRTANVQMLKDLPNFVRLHDAVLLRGLDYGCVAPTGPERALHGSAHPEATLAGVAKLLECGIVGYMDQVMLNTHLLFHDIRPLPQGREGANGAGMLGMHMDLGFRPSIRPNYLMLAGLREGPDRDVKTPLVASKALHQNIMRQFPEDLPVLRDANSWHIISPETSGAYKVHTPLLTGGVDNQFFIAGWTRCFP